MKNRSMLWPACALFLLLFSASTWMDEGMWLPNSVNTLPLEKLKQQGLELTPEQIYSDTQPSLKDAFVLLPGGTGGFISGEGLIITNHHIAFAGIQALSSVEADYLKNGFVARSRDEELSTSYTARIVSRIWDVTTDVRSVINDTMSLEAAAKAAQAKAREIERACDDTSDHAFSVSEMYNGVKYYLFMFEELLDVRLVYAPPGSIGNYGGEVDNWTWPRHTGDFALMRAYVGPGGKPAKYAMDNVPYNPKVFLPVSSKGYAEGSFAMIMGFPGRTQRYREASSVQLSYEETLPTFIDMFKTRIDIIEKAGKRDRAVAIKYATKLRRIANTYKNYIGTLEGMRRTDLLQMKRKQEEDFLAYVTADPALTKSYGSVLAEMQKASDEYRRVNRKNIFFTNLTAGVDLLRIANRLTSMVDNLPKESRGTITETERSPVMQFVAETFKDHDGNVDRETLIALILKSYDLPKDQQVSAFNEIASGRTGAQREKRVVEFVSDLYEETMLATEAGCSTLLAEGKDDINDDEFVKFARKIAAEQAPVSQQVSKYTATIGALRGKYLEGWLEWKQGEHLYPDANRTLRLTYGTVQSLRPRDGVSYSMATTLTGVMEKETGEDPFEVPARLKELWLKKDFGDYADPKLGDIPIAFIANLDITGGNSGSPVVNGKGELIGCAFDGNWEAVVGDYYFRERINRSINIDSRYMLFLLDKFSGAQNILKELVVR